MPFTFRMNFNFLCAFVPERPFDDLTNPPRNCQVLLRDLREPGELGVAEERAHFPVILHNVGDRESTDLPETRFESNPDGIRAILNLDGDDVRIRIDDRDPAPDLLVPINGIPSRGDTVNPAGLERNFLRWLVDPTRWLGTSLVNSDFRQGDGTDDAPLAARIHLSEGQLFTSRLSQDTWSFVSDEDGTVLHRQFLALTIAYECLNVERHVDLEVESFDGGTGSIRFRPATPDQRVTIHVRNAEGSRRFTRSIPIVYRAEDRDFEFHYDLLAVNPDNAPIPTPPEDLDTGNGPCSPVTTQGFGP